MIRVPQTQGSGWDAYKILAGAYDVPFLKFKGVPRILDIGANIGAFSMWAMQKWPGCPIRAFEPLPTAWAYFLSNTKEKVPLIKKAVYPKSPVVMHRMPKNDQVSSIRKEEWHTEAFEVEAVHPKDLPTCEVLKIDTEGAEVEILEGYKYKPSLILLEAHGEKDRWKIEDMLKKDYEWVLGDMWIHGYCEMKFVRRDLLK